MQPLETIIQKLEQKPEVDAVFLTGSVGNNTSTTDSDIDLIIILKDNTQGIESVFTWIGGVFADIYFFDLKNITRIIENDTLSSESSHMSDKMNHLLYAWLKKGEIRFDKSGELTKLKLLEKELVPVSEQKKWNSWVDANYNFEANTRYFNAKDLKYHEALEMRLLYSVIQVICTYFDFIGEQWRGEKLAIAYLKEHDSDFYEMFIRYTKATNLGERFVEYSAMVHRVFELNPKYPLWKKDEIIPKSQRGGFKIDEDLLEFWSGLIA